MTITAAARNGVKSSAILSWPQPSSTAFCTQPSWFRSKGRAVRTARRLASETAEQLQLALESEPLERHWSE
jgi:hypothetical protein